jgi:hypothetical protein
MRYQKPLQVSPIRYEGSFCLMSLQGGALKLLGDTCPSHLLLRPTAEGVIITAASRPDRDQPDGGPMVVGLYVKGINARSGAAIVPPEYIARLDIQWINAYFAVEPTPGGILMRSKASLTEIVIDPITGKVSMPVVSIVRRRPRRPAA